MLRIRKSNKCKIKVTSIALPLIMIPFFFPGGMTQFPGLGNINYVFHALKIISIVIFFLTEKQALKTYGQRNACIAAFLFGLAVSLTNLIHGDNILALRTAVFFPMFMLICIHYLVVKFDEFVLSLCSIFGLYNIFEALTVIKYYPHGVNNYTGYFWEQTLAGAQYFFGSKNQAFFYMLFFLLFVSIKQYRKTKKTSKRIFVYIALFMFEGYKLGSANTLVCLILFWGFYLLCTTKAYEKVKVLFKPRIYIAIGIAIFFVICVFSLGGQFRLVSIMLSLMGRDSTFTNRTYIWNITLNYFKSSPIIGVGNLGIELTNSVQTQAHNMYLNTLYQNGLAGFIPYIWLVFHAGECLNRRKPGFYGAILTGFMFIMLLHNCFDAMDDYLYILSISLFCTEGIRRKVERCN